MSGAFGGVPNAFQNAVTATGLQLDNNNATISAYINDPTNRNNFATDSGNTATFAISLAPAAAGYTAGLWITFKTTNANAANPQVNVNALGAKNLVDQNKTGLLANAIPAGGLVDAVYDGTAFVAIMPMNAYNGPLLSNPSVAGTVTGTITFLGPFTVTNSATMTVTGAFSVGGVTAFAAGSTSAPSITLGGDATSGLFRPGANILALAISSNEAWRSTAQGYFKASNSGPAYKNATGAYHEFYQDNNSALQVLNVRNAAASAANQNGILIELTGDPNGTGTYFWQAIGNATERATIRSNGGLANFSANNVNLSDMSIKQSLEPLETNWEKVQGIRASIQYFQYADASNKDEASSWCCSPMAQAVELHYPEYVVPFSKSGLKGVREQPLLWELIGNLIDEIASLKAKLP